MSEHLRVVDLGTVSPLRSQTSWHALAHGVARSGRPTLSFVRSRGGYASLGYHRALAEVDPATCGRRGWPIYRRMVGGGPVLVDDAQLTFQLSLPAYRLPAARGRAVALVLGALLPAYRAAGVDAALDRSGELVEGDRKVCGHAAGQVGEAVVIVGNLIERFDHDGAASILAAPDRACTRALAALMRRYVGPAPGAAPDAEAFKVVAVAQVAALLGTPAAPGDLDDGERAWLRRLDRRFASSAWTAGAVRAAPEVWRAKVRAGVWLVVGARHGTAVRVTVIDGCVVDLVVSCEGERVRSAFAAEVRGRSLADAMCILGAAPGLGERAARALQGVGVLAG